MLPNAAVASFPASMTSNMVLVTSEHCSMAPPQKAMDDVARRLIRTLVMNTQDMPEGKASAGSYFAKLVALPYISSNTNLWKVQGAYDEPDKFTHQHRFHNIYIECMVTRTWFLMLTSLR